MRCAIKTCTHNIIVTDAPSIRLTFPVIKVHVDEFSSARIWQHKLCETLSASVNISSNQSILPYLYISESKFWCKFEKVKLTMKIIMFRLHMPVWHVIIMCGTSMTSLGCMVKEKLTEPMISSFCGKVKFSITT
jgi:hypothetical protein